MEEKIMLCKEKCQAGMVIRLLLFLYEIVVE